MYLVRNNIFGSNSVFQRYYSIVSDPIDLSKIMLKMRKGHYATLGHFRTDMKRMILNYKRFFNDPTSEVSTCTGSVHI